MIEKNIMEELRKFNAQIRRNHEHHHCHGPQGCPPAVPAAPWAVGPDGCRRPPFMPPRCQGPHFHGMGRILDQLSETEGIGQIQLAEKLEIRPQSVSEAVRHLVEKGFARKELCGDDRRAVRIFLTEEGAIFRAEMQEMREYRLGRRFAALTDDEKQELLRLLKKLNEAAEKEA